MSESRRVAIVGIYTTEQKRGLGRSLLSLTMEAIHGALDDAGILPDEVDGYISYQFPAGNGSPASGEGVIARQWGRPIRFSAETSGAKAVLLAAAAIDAGIAHTVIIPAGGSQTAGAAMASYTRPEFEFTEWTGSMTPAQYALIAQRHMHEFGSTAEQFAQVASAIHRHGRLNPSAMCFGQPNLSPQEILNARMIAEPFTQPMCSLVNDGASCLVVTSAERARDCRHAPVWVLGGATEARSNSYYEAPSLDLLGSRPTMIDGFKRAGVRHEDTDIYMCYDHFAYGPIVQAETLGFCEPGEGADFVLETMGLDGKHPLCVDGGNLAFSHNGIPYNFKQIEIVRQYRNTVEDLCPGWREGVHTYDRAICRKVRDPKLGVGCNPLTDGRHAFTLLAKD